MNYGMPPGAGGGPGGSGGGPPAGTAKQQALHQHIQQIRSVYQTNVQHCQMMFNSGQITQQELQMRIQHYNTQMQQFMNQAHMRYQNAPDNWQPGMQMMPGGKEPTAAERKRFIEMQKKQAAAAAAAAANQGNMMMRPGPMAYPQTMDPRGPAGQQQQQQQASMMHQQRMAAMNHMSQTHMMAPQQQQPQQYPPSSQHAAAGPSAGVGGASSSGMTAGHGGPSSVPQQQQQQQVQQQHPQQHQHHQQMPTQSPRMNFQPPTPQHGPGSVASESGPSSVVGSSNSMPTTAADLENNAIYSKKVKEMKMTYYEKLQEINERARLENAPPPKGYAQCIEIMDKKRIIPLETLSKIEKSLALLVARDCVTFPLMEGVRHLLFEKEEVQRAAMAAKAEMERGEAPTTSTSSSTFKDLSFSEKEGDGEEQQEGGRVGDPWRDFKTEAITVPKHVRLLVKNALKNSELSKKRKRESAENERVEREAKRRKLEEEEEEKEKMEQEEQEKEEEGVEEEVEEGESSMMMMMTQEVNCVLDNRRKWEMPKEAENELKEVAEWYIDTQCLPTCSASPFVVICLKSPMLLCPPLKITVPNRYPEKPATVIFDRSFPTTTMFGAPLKKLFEKWIGVRSSARTISDFYEAFNEACNEFIMYQKSTQVIGGSHLPIPSSAEYDSVVVTANKTSKIAHKGMVA